MSDLHNIDGLFDPITNCICGGDARLGQSVFGGWYVECLECGKQTGVSSTPKGIISSWNFYLFAEKGILVGIAPY